MTHGEAGEKARVLLMTAIQISKTRGAKEAIAEVSSALLEVHKAGMEFAITEMHKFCGPVEWIEDSSHPKEIERAIRRSYGQEV